MRRALMIGTTLACLGLATAVSAQPSGGTGNHNYGSHPPMASPPPPPPPPVAAATAPAPPLEYDIATTRQAIDEARAAHKIGPHKAHRLERRLEAAKRKLGKLSHEVAAIHESLPTP